MVRWRRGAAGWRRRRPSRWCSSPGCRSARGREVPAWRSEHRARRPAGRLQRAGPARRRGSASRRLVIGRVARVSVREGDRVAAGQLLVQLEDAEAAASLRQAQGRVAEAAARLEQVRGVAGRLAAEALRQAELRVGRRGGGARAGPAARRRRGHVAG